MSHLRVASVLWCIASLVYLWVAIEKFHDAKLPLGFVWLGMSVASAAWGNWLAYQAGRTSK